MRKIKDKIALYIRSTEKSRLVGREEDINIREWTNEDIRDFIWHFRP